MFHHLFQRVTPVVSRRVGTGQWQASPNLKGQLLDEPTLTKEEFDYFYANTPLEFDEETPMTREAADLKLLSIHRKEMVSRLEARGETSVGAGILGELLGSAVADPTTYIGLGAGQLGAASLSAMVKAARSTNRARNLAIGAAAAGALLDIGASTWVNKLASESIGDEMTLKDVGVIAAIGGALIGGSAYLQLARASKIAAREAGETAVDGAAEVLEVAIERGDDITVKQAEDLAQREVPMAPTGNDKVTKPDLVPDGTKRVEQLEVRIKDEVDGKTYAYRNNIEAALHAIAKSKDEGFDDAVDTVRESLIDCRVC